jgi:hypothetical protein
LRFCADTGALAASNAPRINRLRIPLLPWPA